MNARLLNLRLLLDATKVRMIVVGGERVSGWCMLSADGRGPSGSLRPPLNFWRVGRLQAMQLFFHTPGEAEGGQKCAVHQQKDMMVATRSYAEDVLGIRADDRFFSVSKLFFAYGLGNGMYFPLSAGASVVLNPEKTRVERVAELVARHRPTIFFGVPTFYAALLQESNRGVAMDLSSVRLAVSAGEPLPAEVFAQFRERFGIAILDGIGSTEMLHIFLSNSAGRRAGWDVRNAGPKLRGANCLR